MILAFAANAAAAIPLRVGPCSRTSGRRRATGGSCSGYDGASSLRRLRRIRAQDFVFQRRPVKAFDDRLHFIRGWCFHESEDLGLLGFVVANNLYGIRDKVFSGEPLFNVVGCDPQGQIAQKNGKAHPVF